jgi:hypothetical protein
MKISVIHSAFEESGRVVACVDVPDTTPISEALEYAYFRTQNLHGSWSREKVVEIDGVRHDNPDFSEDVTVTVDLPTEDGITYGLRSTSRGDRMIINETCYKVEFAGFSTDEEFIF